MVILEYIIEALFWSSGIVLMVWLILIRLMIWLLFVGWFYPVAFIHWLWLARLDIHSCNLVCNHFVCCSGSFNRFRFDQFIIIGFIIWSYDWDLDNHLCWFCIIHRIRVAWSDCLIWWFDHSYSVHGFDGRLFLNRYYLIISDNSHAYHIPFFCIRLSTEYMFVFVRIGGS